MTIAERGLQGGRIGNPDDEFTQMATSQRIQADGTRAEFMGDLVGEAEADMATFGVDHQGWDVLVG